LWVYLEAVKELKRLNAQRFEELSFDERHSMRYQIIVLAEAIGNICIHISLEDLGYEPESYSDCLTYLRDKSDIRSGEDLIKRYGLR